MKPTNLINIDFDDIRESIKSYLRTRNEFTDYDFTGSTLSYLIDVLAYNTYYSAFNANMAINELFLDSASIRDNVISLAKSLNYTPRSISSAKACITLAAQTEITVDGTYPSTATLQKGDVSVGNVNGVAYTFVVLDDKTVSVDKSTGIALFESLKVYEGSLLSYQYTVNNKLQQHYIIPNDNVDTDTLKVYVRPDIQSTTYDRYNLVSNVTAVESIDKIFFLNEADDRRYEIVFGDGVVGRKLVDNEVIYIEYVKTSGASANNINSMGYIGKVIDSNDNPITDVTLILTDKSQLGASAESLSSIKFNAPKYYSAQNRAVTSNDFEAIIRNIYPNARYVNAFGGELLNPPQYGKVIVTIKTTTGNKLNNLTKKDIIAKLKPYSMASVETVITDPEEIFMNLTLYVSATTFRSVLSDDGTGAVNQNTSDDIRKKILAAIQEYGNREDLGNFGKTLSLSQLQKIILDADPNIQDVQFGVTPYKVIAYENLTTPKSWDINFNVKLDCACDSATGETVRSSKFYTPGVTQPQFLEDDGAGKLISYYIDNNKKIITNKEAGTYDCDTGKVKVGPLTTINGPDGDGDPPLIAISIKPKNPATTPAPPGSILTIPVPTINIGDGIPESGPGGSAGDPSTFNPTPSTFTFTSPVATPGAGSCFS